jgi:hypothetical protein
MILDHSPFPLVYYAINKVTSESKAGKPGKSVPVTGRGGP